MGIAWDLSPKVIAAARAVPTIFVSDLIRLRFSTAMLAHEAAMPWYFPWYFSERI
jgi:hypothetical protein